MSNDDKDFLLDLQKLINEENAISLQPEDVTASRVVKQSGWNRHMAVRMIQIWEKEGRLEALGKRRDPASGMKVEAWRVKHG